MKTILMLGALTAACTVLNGCVTKPLGREESLTQTERSIMTCRDIDIGIARTQAFTQRIVNDPTDARDVSGFLLDWGIGNHMEKTDALKSATNRQEQLEHLRAQKNCPLSTASAQSAN